MAGRTLAYAPNTFAARCERAGNYGWAIFFTKDDPTTLPRARFKLARDAVTLAAKGRGYQALERFNSLAQLCNSSLSSLLASVDISQRALTLDQLETVATTIQDPIAIRAALRILRISQGSTFTSDTLDLISKHSGTLFAAVAADFLIRPYGYLYDDETLRSIACTPSPLEYAFAAYRAIPENDVLSQLYIAAKAEHPEIQNMARQALAVMDLRRFRRIFPDSRVEGYGEIYNAVVSRVLSMDLAECLSWLQYSSKVRGANPVLSYGINTDPVTYAILDRFVTDCLHDSLFEVATQTRGYVALAAVRALSEIGRDAGPLRDTSVVYLERLTREGSKAVVSYARRLLHDRARQFEDGSLLSAS